MKETIMPSALAIDPILSEANSPSRRLYFLDNLKTFIIILVVFFHAAYAYAIYYSKDWYVVDPQKKLFFDIFISAAFAFIMPVMFYVAGYFGIRSLARKGQYTFWKDKINRIVIPWGLGVLFLAPAIGYMHPLSRNLHPSYLSYWVHYFFGKEYQSHGQVHFYFLGTLTLYFLALSLAYRIHEPLGQISDKPMRSLGLFFILFGLLTGLIFFCGNLVVGEELWAKIAIFDFPASRFIPYMGYFFLGIFAYKQQWFTASGYNPRLRWWLPLCVIFFILTISLIDKRSTNKIGMICFAVSYFFFCLTAVFSLLAIFQKRLNFTTSLLSSLAANSYAIYFLHYFVILWVILVLRGSPWNAFLKWFLVGIISNIICYLLARYALSRTPMFRTQVKSIG